MSYTILVSALAALIVTYFMTRYAIRYFNFVGLVSTDVHKKNKPLIASSAGIPLMAGLIFGLLVYIFINIFIFNVETSLAQMFAAITSIFIIAFVGLLDDLNTVQVKVHGFAEGKRGLKRWQKPLLTLAAALPLIAIVAGTTNVFLPLVGNVELGLLYPFLVVPLAIVIASNAVNMLGGYNGLEVGMGLVYTFALGSFAIVNGSELSAVLFFVTFAGLLAVARFNFPPAKILPGDSLTYLLGAVLAVGAIIGNMEKAVLIMGMVSFFIFSVGEYWL